MRALLALAVLGVALAGCGAPAPPDDGARTAEPPRDAPRDAPDGGAERDREAPPEAPRAPSLQGPAWQLGEAWTYSYRRGDAEATHELVVFRQDDEHWWLGLANRTLALEHALRDTNPLIGRIHRGILSPHEKGRHVGMYSFPLEDGKAWSGDLFGGTWQFQARWDAAAQKYLIAGAGADGSRIALDYSVGDRWFSALRTEGVPGPLELTLQGHRTGLTGTFHFFRGVDVYQGPGPQGPGGAALHIDEFPVEDGFGALGLSLKATATGPALVVVLDPANEERYRRALAAGEAVDELAELPARGGTWRVVYSGLANLQAEVRAAGLEQHIETI